MKIISSANYQPKSNLLIHIDNPHITDFLDTNQQSYLEQKKSDKADLITFDFSGYFIFVINLNHSSEDKHIVKEKYRKLGSKIFASLNAEKHTSVHLSLENLEQEYVLSITEGLYLGAYRFTKYHTEKDRNKSYLSEISVHSALKQSDLDELNNIGKAVYFSRDLVNEPLSFLTAEQLGKEIKKSAKAYGFSAEVLGKKQIEALKMGGLLAVNKGSFDPPSFSILEWKPEKPRNKQPLIFVGKGVVFDTGGLSLKPTAGSMDEMKSDMAGAAAVIGAMQAIASNQLNVHVIALVPATDNRPGNKAYAPQDIIEMYDGTKVEVLNTDAEGRMILADALAYAKKYQPELVINLATLTGAAHMAIGPYGIVAMGNANEKTKQKLNHSGKEVYERLVEFPLWDEYQDLIKSDIADIKNIGGRVGGAITAGKFLEHFTDYPFMHLDIAGPAYINAKDAYRTQGGTAVGVRLLYHFAKNY